MARTPANTDPPHLALSSDLARGLGARRSDRLRSLMRYTGLPPEVLLDLALELVDIASRRLSPLPIQRTAVGLGAARWRNISPKERSDIMRQVSLGRWGKQRRRGDSAR